MKWDDRKARLCWRSDGEYFVLGFVESANGTAQRKFQIFSREGVFHSTIEKDIQILDAPIRWKYSKCHLAGSVYRFNKHEIVFFERNGLAHGGFTLPFAPFQMRVKGIFWNMDGTILCVWSEQVDSTAPSTSQSTSND